MSVTTSGDFTPASSGYVVAGRKKPDTYRKRIGPRQYEQKKLSEMPQEFQVVINAWNIYAPMTYELKAHVATFNADWDADVEYCYKIGSGGPEMTLKGHVHVKKAGHGLNWIAGHCWIEGIYNYDASTPAALVDAVKTKLSSDLAVFLA